MTCSLLSVSIIEPLIWYLVVQSCCNAFIRRGFNECKALNIHSITLWYNVRTERKTLL